MVGGNCPGRARTPFRRPFSINVKGDLSMKHTNLARLREGESGWVTGIEGRGAMSRRLQDMGLVRGTRVECLHRSPFGDPAAYLIRGAVIALRQEDSGRVLVDTQ